MKKHFGYEDLGVPLTGKSDVEILSDIGEFIWKLLCSIMVAVFRDDSYIEFAKKGNILDSDYGFDPFLSPSGSGESPWGDKSAWVVTPIFLTLLVGWLYPVECRILDGVGPVWAMSRDARAVQVNTYPSLVRFVQLIGPIN